MSMSREQTIQILDLLLAFIGIIPEIISEVQGLFDLRSKVLKGEEVTQEDLNLVLQVLRARSKAIQAS